MTNRPALTERDRWDVCPRRRFESGAGTLRAASSSIMRQRSPRAWWSSMQVHQIQAAARGETWRCAGIARPENAARVPPKMNGNPRLMCMSHLNQLDLGRAGHDRANARVSAGQFATSSPTCRGTSRPRSASGNSVPDRRRRRRHLADGTRSMPNGCRNSASASMLPLSGRLSCAARPSHVRSSSRGRATWSTRRRSR